MKHDGISSQWLSSKYNEIYFFKIHTFLLSPYVLISTKNHKDLFLKMTCTLLELQYRHLLAEGRWCLVYLCLFRSQTSARGTCRGIFCVPLIKLRGGCCFVDTGGIIDHHHLKFLFWITIPVNNHKLLRFYIKKIFLPMNSRMVGFWSLTSCICWHGIIGTNMWHQFSLTSGLL